MTFLRVEGVVQLGNVTLGGKGRARPKVCDVTFGVAKPFLITLLWSETHIFALGGSCHMTKNNPARARRARNKIVSS